MPLHDWNRVGDWVHEDFRLGWLVYLRNALNAGGLPPGHHAHITRRSDLYRNGGAPAVGSAVGVRAGGGRVVAVVELVSAGNKVRPSAVADFARKLATLIRSGVHAAVVDIGPQDQRSGIVYTAIGRDLGMSLNSNCLGSHVVASFRADPPAAELFLDDFTFGQSVPTSHLFLDPASCVPLPLGETYQYAISMLDLKSRAALTAD